MTERSESERAELVAIAGQIDIFIKYGTNAIFEPDGAKKIASALRRLAAQDQKPPPAAGWEDAIEAAMVEIVAATRKWGDPCGSAYEQGIQDHGNRCLAAVKALRHNAPPDSGAGKSQTDDLCRDISKMAERVGAEFVPDQQKIDAFDAAHMPDHGGADAGVRKALQELRDANMSYSLVSNCVTALRLEQAMRDADAALSKSAPVAANASAEAQLRKALEQIIRYCDESTDPVIALTAKKALSAHPHASDCDKTAYDVLGDQRTCVGVPASGIAKLMDAIENPPQPNEALKKLMRDHASDCDKQGER